jgi:hypothetical protein
VRNRRLKPDSERLLCEAIEVWAASAERLPVSWIVEDEELRLCRQIRTGVLFDLSSHEKMAAGLFFVSLQPFVAVTVKISKVAVCSSETLLVATSIPPHPRNVHPSVVAVFLAAVNRYSSVVLQSAGRGVSTVFAGSLRSGLYHGA